MPIWSTARPVYFIGKLSNRLMARHLNHLKTTVNLTMEHMDFQPHVPCGTALLNIGYVYLRLIRLSETWWVHFSHVHVDASHSIHSNLWKQVLTEFLK